MLKGLGERAWEQQRATSPANLSCLRAESPAKRHPAKIAAWQCMLLSNEASRREVFPACETAPVPPHAAMSAGQNARHVLRKPHLMEAEHFRSMLDKVAYIYPRAHCPSMYLYVCHA